ncbi:gas vesicle protein GvpG [Streptomyces katrae]|uniref:gas vesicle protein GvpG n=1 Tax=Streptomyces katrae TaxID=68223 RepID=UPI0004C0E22C|nr:gas vesicle protein GvpG [Streptomyces katrae]
MGLLTYLLTLPLAPVRAVTWVAQRVVDKAEEEYYDPAPIWQRLAQLEQQLVSGEIDQETFDRCEDELIGRLTEIADYRNQLS